MKITVLAENTACSSDLLAEHGLSLYIETQEHKILFDTGQTDAFAANAQRLGVDLSAVDFMVLSHGHYDHGGGISAFLALNKTAPIYINKNAFGDFYDAEGKYIGLDKALLNHPRIIKTETLTKVANGITLFTCNVKTADAFGLIQKVGERLLPDDFSHEQYLEILEDGKKTLFSGCSHKGILNIMESVRPNVMVGGFHFMKLDPEGTGVQVLNRAAEVLLRYDCSYYTCHCTGTDQFTYLKRSMGNRLHYIAAGARIEL